VIAAVIRLLDQEYLRVGNEAYAQENNSFGATTLRSRHAKLLGRVVKMRFKGKGGIEREITITDRTLTRIVRRCADLPGQHLFQYVDDDGSPQPVTSSDVNDYIRDAMGEEFTAKHFRTWGASAIAFAQLCNAGEDGLSLREMLEPVAEALGNTPAISRKSYVHPDLIEAVKNNPRNLRQRLQCPRATRYLSSAERGLIAFLEGDAVSGGEQQKAA
jgi:DNA topoisomerase-1